MLTHQAGRGSQVNPHNRFDQFQYDLEEDYLEYLRINGEDVSQPRKTTFLEVFPKTLVNKITSPDIGREWSMNPYQGCEHGCAYCYARNSHQYWGYSAGSEFEEVILVKKNAPELLVKHLKKPSWQPAPIMLSGNTDCYQPAEAKFGITRELLKILENSGNPVGIITKNALIQRDLDILKKMAEKRLVHVSISITSLDETLRRKLEPRTATAKKRLQTVEMLSSNGIPVNVMMAPIIPGLNSHEVFDIARASAEAGAVSAHYTMVRLNGQIAEIFRNWSEANYPDRADKIQHLIEETHGGRVNDSQFGRRMHGEGHIAVQVKRMVELARKKFFKDRYMPAYNYEHFRRPESNGQTSLF